MGNGFNVEQGQYGLSCPGTMTFQALPVTSEDRT